ncbi:MAG: hypothetical protein MHM6MM_007730, partial [Cercozoa sp. M6MM]
MRLLLSALLLGAAAADNGQDDRLVKSVNSLSANSEQCAARFGRIDCGYMGIDEGECVRRNCCWSPTEDANTPWCFHASASTQYTLTDVKRRGRGLDLSLELHKGLSQFGQDMPNVKVTIDFLDREVVRVKFSNADANRFEIPSFAVPDNGDGNWNTEISAAFERGSDSVFEGSDDTVVFQ